MIFGTFHFPNINAKLLTITFSVFPWGTTHFGLVDCDFASFKRTPKPSAYFYKEIMENNGFTQEILRKYLKELPTLAKI
ncbi:MAG: family 1 glycosylhydrolase [Clostridia bacterium]|nr:family 1 glycosylhydrolase [Clostridia bacterium]